MKKKKNKSFPSMCLLILACYIFEASHAWAGVICKETIVLGGHLLANIGKLDPGVRHDIITKLASMAQQASEEWGSIKYEDMMKIKSSNIVTNSEAMQFSLNTYNNCTAGGPNYLLRDSLERAIFQGKENRENQR